MLKNENTIQDVTVKVASEDGNYAILFSTDIARLDLVVENPRRLGLRRLNELINFCDQLTGTQSFCGHHFRHYKAQAYTWFMEKEYIKPFMSIMANSDGFIDGGYESLTLSDGYKLEDYRDDTERQKLAQRKMTMARA